MSLGREVSINLGLNYQKQVRIGLALVSILMAVSTALIGSLTFLGFLVVTFTYELIDTYDFKYQAILSMVLSYMILASAYFVMYHFVNAQGVVTILI